MGGNGGRGGNAVVNAAGNGGNAGLGPAPGVGTGTPGAGGTSLLGARITLRRCLHSRWGVHHHQSPAARSGYPLTARVSA